MLAHLETFHATKRHQIQARDLCVATVGACQVGARKVRRPQTGISILNPALDSHQQPVCKRKVQAQFRVKGASHAAMGQFCLALASKHPKITFFRPSSQTPLSTPDTLRHGNRLCLTLRLSRWRRQRCDPPQHSAEEPARQMTLRQQQPVVAGVLEQAAAGFHQPLLQAGQRPTVAPCRQRRPPTCKSNCSKRVPINRVVFRWQRSDRPSHSSSKAGSNTPSRQERDHGASRASPRSSTGTSFRCSAKSGSINSRPSRFKRCLKRSDSPTR
jgi:hypothetical protein